MASARAQPSRGGGLSVEPVVEPLDKRISNATVFDEVEAMPRRTPLSCTLSMPLTDKRASKSLAPPPDMEEIE